MLEYVLIFFSVVLFVIGILFLFLGGAFQSQEKNVTVSSSEIDDLESEELKFLSEFAQMQLDLNDFKEVALQNKRAAATIKQRVEEVKAKFSL